jgi:hypothetical protein
MNSTKKTSNASSEWEVHKGLLRHQVSSFKIQGCTDSDVLNRKITHNHISAIMAGIVWWITDMKTGILIE